VVGLQQIDRVVIAAAAQEGEEIAAPIRHFESEHAIKLHGRCDVGRMKGDVTELARHDAGVAIVILGEGEVGKDCDARPLGIGEHDRLRMPGVMPLRRSDLIPAFASRAESSPRSLPGATWKASRTPAGRSPCSSTIASCPGLVARIARPFSLATM